MDIKVKKVRENATIPVQATSGSAGFDLHVTAFLDNKGNEITTDKYYLHEHRTETIRCATGLAFEIPEGYCMKILPRSGLAFKENITVVNAPGLIDSDYRGEVVVGLIKHHVSESVRCSTNSYSIINIGDRIAQAVIEKYEKPNFIEVEELSETSRGEGKFGSTGK